MKAKVTMIGFEADKVRIGFDCFLEKDEVGYKDCLVRVPIRLLTDEERLNPELAKLVPTRERLNPINRHFVKVPFDITKKQLVEIMQTHLQALKRSIPKAKEVERNWMGFEITE